MAKSKMKDRKLIALKQKYEVDYIHLKYDIPKADIRAAVKAVGRGRKKVYDELRKNGHTIPV